MVETTVQLEFSLPASSPPGVQDDVLMGALLTLQSRFFLGHLIFPVFVGGLSVAVLLIQLLLNYMWRSKKSSDRRLASEGASADSDTLEADPLTVEELRWSPPITRHFAERGTWVVFAMDFARFISCLGLLILSIISPHSIAHEEDDLEFVAPGFWLLAGFYFIYAYATTLALITVVGNTKMRAYVTPHLVSVLLCAWIVYAYRDMWPLAMFTLSPMDAAEGPLLWVKIADLTFAAVLVPLLIPRVPASLDLKKSAGVGYPPEQTASLFSLMVFSWLDGTVYKAYRKPHLPIDELPQIPDGDSAQTLVKKTFDVLDPLRAKDNSTYIGWGLARLYRTDIIVMGILLTIYVFTTFATPLAVKNLLSYIETRGHNSEVRPWLWISWLFFGPMLGVIAYSCYYYVSMRMSIHLEVVLTQLVFDHALRIRMKADVAETSAAATEAATSTDASNTVPAASGQSSDPPEAQRNADSGRDGAALAGSSTVSIETSSTKGKERSTGASINSDSNEGKGKGKKAVPKDDAEEKGKHALGKMNNLITSDIAALARGLEISQILVRVPIQLVLCIWFLYAILGWSAFAGLAVIVALLPVPGQVAKLVRKVQADRMKKSDARVQSTTEALGIIRMIKLFSWEGHLMRRLMKKREDELALLQKGRFLMLLNSNISLIIPMLTMVITFLTYTVIMKQELTASKVFSSMTVFEMLSSQLRLCFGLLNGFIRAKVSLDRLDDFLQKSELLDEFSQNTPTVRFEGEDTIGFRDAAFTWTNEEDMQPPSIVSRRSFTLRIEGELIFRRNYVNLIIGPTGSGKTSVLMALLGEMHYLPSTSDSFYHLPRSGGVAYAAQESWVQNETIRNNILFGAPYDEQRYNKVIDQCGLRRDLELFEAGDRTEVGEKGITLSGGQKARVTLARAVYSSAEILLLDDILAALDVHTARWIIDECFKGDLIRGRTVILVTHNVALASPIAHFTVALGIDGRILSQGSLSNALDHSQTLAAEMMQEQKMTEKAEHDSAGLIRDNEPKTSIGKLTVAEEIAEGHVGWIALKLFLTNLGGRHQFAFWLSCLSALLVSQFTSNYQVWYLGYWARQYEEHPAEEVQAPLYLTVYTIILMSTILLWCTHYIIFTFGAMRASRFIHNALLYSILGTTLRWLDKTPAGRIVARCTHDISTGVSRLFQTMMDMSTSMIAKLAAVILMSPIFMVPGVFLIILGGAIGQVYMKAQLSVKREKSNARAPVLGHFGAAFAGLISIRAYGAQDAFRNESHIRINKHTRAARIFWQLNRWVNIRIEALGALFSIGLAAYLIYSDKATASKTGFSLNMAVGFSNMILWFVRMFNEFEVTGNSLERIQQYLEIEQEPKPSEISTPPAYWPASGALKVENLSARYSPDGPQVLHEISFEVNSGERIGIVGRTGSGKSSLTLALLRCIITEGKVYYDGLDTNNVNLDALRSCITIIPQTPEMLSGSLRENLDPFEEFDDAALNDALRSAGLFSLQKDTEQGQITLDTQIAAGGGNLSVGQRQILALARAIVRQSKLLILDEATSAVDYTTDSVIQTSLRKELGKDVTVLTVAHRLQTIMDADKIMVLDAGRIVEFGRPAELLKLENGMLRALVDESGEREILYNMAAQVGTAASA